MIGVAVGGIAGYAVRSTVAPMPHQFSKKLSCYFTIFTKCDDAVANDDYQWTNETVEMKGLWMAKGGLFGMPKEEFPTIRWLLTVLSQAVGLVGFNAITDVGDKPAAPKMIEQLRNLNQEALELGRSSSFSFTQSSLAGNVVSFLKKAVTEVSGIGKEACKKSSDIDVLKATSSSAVLGIFLR